MLQWPCRSGEAKCTDLWQAVKKVAKQKGTTWLLWFEVQLHQPYLGVHSHSPGLLREPHAPFLQLKKKKKKNQLTFFLPQIARTLRIWYSMTTCIQNRIFQFLKERKKEKNKTLALCHFFFPHPHLMIGPWHTRQRLRWHLALMAVSITRAGHVVPPKAQ